MSRDYRTSPLSSTVINRIQSALLATPHEFHQGVKLTDQSDQEYRALLEELNTVLSERTQAAVSDRIALRDAVCQYVEAEHSRGTPLAAIIATVKDILQKAEPDSANVPEELAEQLVEWCRQFHGKKLARDLQ